MKPHVLFIDNFDSFTFNLVEAFERLGCTVRVLRNTVDARDALALAEAEGALIVLSPGPGTPRDAGCCLELIRLAKGKVPLLGICLGHQAIVEQAGGAVVRAPAPVHGKASRIDHDGEGPLRGLESPLTVGRYHSLCTRDLPPRFRVHAEVDGMAMAISDPQARQTGLQFHPESILTLHGDAILHNVLEQVAGLQREAEPEDAASAGLLAVGAAGA
jgi:anthranilate synthase/aminodeoxychorismate synthase-like glutamine amidotransferase